MAVTRNLPFDWRDLARWLVPIVLLSLVAVAIVLRAVPTALYLRLPARRRLPWAIFGFLVTGPIALILGPYLARPFFGDVSYTILIGALVPALVFAVSNGVMNEVIYRGALMGWSGRVMGTGPALVGQAAQTRFRRDRRRQPTCLLPWSGANRSSA
ncbi:MAG TPA: hypothetical protein VFN41_01420 [Candidatus Limnocylindrales bacterium]|nr:hypothetical protein [Candidatus Limnocylindrales bacterium]